MPDSNIERISFIALGGISIAIFSLFIGNTKEFSYNNNPPIGNSSGHKQIEHFVYNDNIEKSEKFRTSHELAKILKNRGLPEEAIEEYKKIIMLDEKSVIAHLELARIYYEKKNYSASILEYRRAAELVPDYMDNHSQIFLGEEIKTAIKETIVELKKINKANPDDKDAKQGIKNAYYLTRKIGAGCE
ncbi:MAG: hypothetical protein AB1498_13055 [bacterium]